MNPVSLPTPVNLGITGFPLGHSLSPRLHAAALAHFNLEGSYQLYPAPPLPQGRQGLSDLLGRLRRGELHGLNVTIPHKQAVLEWVDELTPTAKVIGAVNTLFMRGSSLVGDNTDAAGFWSDAESLFGLEQAGHALVLGAGGAARAVVYALAVRGWQVTIAASRPSGLEKARALAADLAHVGGALDVILLDSQGLETVPGAALVVNATPLGMSPGVDASPWPEGVPFPPGCCLYDAIYNPAETKLVRSARAAGLKAETGLGMLIGQAAAGFECWTGLRVPMEVLRRSVGQKEEG